MKNKFDKLDENNLIDLTAFPFDLKLQSSDTDNKWDLYLNGLEHSSVTVTDKRMPEVGISASRKYFGFEDARVRAFTDKEIMTEDALNTVLTTLFYGIAYGGLKTGDWLAKHPKEAFKTPRQLKDIEYSDYWIIKVPPYETGNYEGHNPDYDGYSEDQYLFIKRGTIPIKLVEYIPISLNTNYKENHVFSLFWYGYVDDFNSDDLLNNRVFFTSKSNLIAGSNDSFGEQTLLADLLDE